MINGLSVWMNWRNSLAQLLLDVLLVVVPCLYRVCGVLPGNAICFAKLCHVIDFWK